MKKTDPFVGLEPELESALIAEAETPKISVEQILISCGVASKQVIALRRKLGLTQSELARKLGVDRAAVNQWEAGTRKPSGMAARFMDLLLELHERVSSNGKEEKARNLRARE